MFEKDEAEEGDSKNCRRGRGRKRERKTKGRDERGAGGKRDRNMLSVLCASQIHFSRHVDSSVNEGDCGVTRPDGHG